VEVRERVAYTRRWRGLMRQKLSSSPVAYEWREKKLVDLALLSKSQRTAESG
jgi:hypothetical protein